MRGRYRIVDPPCLEVLSELAAALEEEGLPFALAGGMAVQALLAQSQLEHLMRRTGDIDLLVHGEAARIVRAFNWLSARRRVDVVQNPGAMNARVGPLNVDWINEPSRLHGLEAAWLPSIEHALRVRVHGIELPVQQPEVLLAAKLTGQRVRPQDELDVAAVLQCGVAFDEDRLRELMAARPERFERFLAIRRSVEEQG